MASGFDLPNISRISGRWRTSPHSKDHPIVKMALHFLISFKAIFFKKKKKSIHLPKIHSPQSQIPMFFQWTNFEDGRYSSHFWLLAHVSTSLRRDRYLWSGPLFSPRIYGFRWQISSPTPRPQGLSCLPLTQSSAVIQWHVPCYWSSQSDRTFWWPSTSMMP